MQAKRLEDIPLKGKTQHSPSPVKKQMRIVTKLATELTHVPPKSPAHNPAHRPRVVDAEVIDKLRTAFKVGASDAEACFYAGISPRTLYNYCSEHPDFAEEKELLKESPVLTARNTVVLALADNPELAFRFLKAKKFEEFQESIKVNMSFDETFTQILEKFTKDRQFTLNPYEEAEIVQEE